MDALKPKTWTDKAWDQKEREAEADERASRVKKFSNVEELIADLRDQAG